MRVHLILTQITHRKCFSEWRPCNNLQMSDVTGFNQCHVVSTGFKIRPHTSARAHVRERRHSRKTKHTNACGTTAERPLPFFVSAVLHVPVNVTLNASDGTQLSGDYEKEEKKKKSSPFIYFMRKRLSHQREW